MTLPPSITPDYQRDWPRYFDAVASLGPRDTLIRAAGLHGQADPANPPMAVDIACGEGRDTRELLARGWRVWAFDATCQAIDRLSASVPTHHLGALSARVLRMEDAAAAEDWPGEVALVNASFALPFCDPAAFPSLWKRIVECLVPGGRFAGQFFGDRDEWAVVRPTSHWRRAEVERLFKGFLIEHFEEVEKDGGDALGITKHHHLYHIVARRVG
ncbi:MAG: class I SAM-dependent methyltransferase [Phycisphaerae bacterium]|nr:class I SAM-dependent methyltransferase [Phycisphaerae bacterium]